jgi:hypothetical protein
MRVEEVHFNHDPASATQDAITICRNAAAGTAVSAPEWRRSPVKREPAAYARDALVGPVTIKARFSGGPPNKKVKIRAVDANAPVKKPGCVGLIVWLFEKLVQALGGAVGEVGVTSVAFDGTGASGLVTMPLTSPWLTPDGFVSKRSTVWRWERKKGPWTAFDTTSHTVYLVLDLPGGPWVQSGDPTQLPWADALDRACQWAIGAKTVDEAAARITLQVNRVPNVTYTPATTFGFFQYQLASYLTHLAGGPFIMNCTDCADAVTTLANVLGCRLAEGIFRTMQTKEFLTLSGDASNPADWVTFGWSYHEICWLNDFASNTVWDGCLQLDMSNTPGVHTALLPVRMDFDTPSADDYKSRLIDTGPGTLDPAVQHRPVV